MGRCSPCSWIICILLCAGWFSGCFSEDEYECEACRDDRNCINTDPQDSGRYATNVTGCPSGVCYVVYGTTTVYSEHSFTHPEYPFVSLGCSKPEDARLPTMREDMPLGTPVFAPLPPPATKPGNEQFACRRNEQHYERITSSMSCFRYTPRCQKELKDISASRLFQGNLIRSLPVEGTNWVIVDRLGVLKAETGVKTYDPMKPDGDTSAKFSCGECPCDLKEYNEECRRLGRYNCTMEGPSLYTVETPCETSHCYMIFGIKENLEPKRGWYSGASSAYFPEPFVGRGCSSADDNEWNDAKNAVGNPLYYAWPVPEPLPGPGTWACRRNRPHDHYLSTVTCFCFTSNCQAGYNPKLDEFRNNVNSNLPQGNYWVCAWLGDLQSTVFPRSNGTRTGISLLPLN